MPDGMVTAPEAKDRPSSDLAGQFLRLIRALEVAEEATDPDLVGELHDRIDAAEDAASMQRTSDARTAMLQVAMAMADADIAWGQLSRKERERPAIAKRERRLARYLWSVLLYLEREAGQPFEDLIGTYHAHRRSNPFDIVNRAIEGDRA